jgi:hypothetical protein
VKKVPIEMREGGKNLPGNWEPELCVVVVVAAAAQRRQQSMLLLLLLGHSCW